MVWFLFVDWRAEQSCDFAGNLLHATLKLMLCALAFGCPESGSLAWILHWCQHGCLLCWWRLLPTVRHVTEQTECFCQCETSPGLVTAVDSEPLMWEQSELWSQPCMWIKYRLGPSTCKIGLATWTRLMCTPAVLYMYDQEYISDSWYDQWSGNNDVHVSSWVKAVRSWMAYANNIACIVLQFLQIPKLQTSGMQTYWFIYVHE